MVTIVDAHLHPHLSTCRALFAEYAVAIDSACGASLAQQGFSTELDNLPGKYAPPRGRMLLALRDGQPIGCAALRPLPNLGPSVCEMKRMWVRPAARGQGVGRMLANRLLSDAAAAGYTLMKLDTSAGFTEAIALYRSLGFVECPRYNDDPMADTLWFERPLAPGLTA